jgi:hypothetical protein
MTDMNLSGYKGVKIMIERSIIHFLLGTFLVLPMAANSATFSIVLLTDSQFYVEQHPEILEAQIDWIVANEATENIIYVVQTGDLKDDQLCDNKTVNVGTGAGRTEWQIADQAFTDLDTANMAYAVVPGNHDFNPVSGSCPNWTTQRPLSQYNTNFGPARFAGDPFYGDPATLTPGNRVTGSNEDNFTLFDSNGVEFIAINLAFKTQPDAVGLGNVELAWADNLLKTYPDRLGILTSHYFLETNPGDNLGPYGQQVYDTLSNNPNLFMMLSGHWYGEAWQVATAGRAGLQPTQIMMANYQDQFFPTDTDAGTPANTPNPALIDFSNIAEGGGTDAGFMRIMRFNTDTGMVDIETFIPPVVPIKNRTGTIVSTYFPASGAVMGRGTASNLSFTYLGYVPTVVSCGIDNTGGDLIDFRGFYHPSYPGSTLNTVELYVSARVAGDYQVRLDAMLNSYDGAVIASNSQTRTLSADDQDNVSYVFDFGNVAVTSGSTIAFTITLESSPPGATQVFYAVDADQYPISGGGAGNCDMIQTTSASPPLDNLRRNGLWIRITGSP